MDPNDAKVQLMAAHDNAEPSNPVSWLRDLVMMCYDRQLLCAVYDGELNLYDTLTYTKIDVTAGRLRYDAHPDSYLSPATAALIQEQATLWERRQPTRLFDGPGFSEEALKLTTLSKYLHFDTWTPEAPAMLVCGLQAPIVDGQLCTDIPEKGAMGLDNCFIVGSHDPFHQAKSVLGILRSQVNPPDRTRPLDFIKWCKSKGIDTSWLRTVDGGVQLAEAVTPMRTIMNFQPRPVGLPNQPLLRPDWLARAIAFALIEIPDDEILKTVRKEVPVGTGESHIESLTGDDWWLIREICGGTPPAPCSRADFQSYCAKFDAAESRPAW
ncbi:hypothetical protein [Paraburkholderia elongata]|uniref:Uncharacterized protein n=1 Tax=Paraburkholderia elongata TaxID=2675747 RepID=A0A972SKL2_9BURK|nr:hypothetical protein [Paraburkholderia elongata]NPT58274.1 hypothetical protein [Paraburkholderia elongata]